MKIQEIIKNIKNAIDELEHHKYSSYCDVSEDGLNAAIDGLAECIDALVSNRGEE